MKCPFPGDLLSQFKGLRGLYLGWNELTVGVAAVGSGGQPAPPPPPPPLLGVSRRTAEA